MERVQSMTVLLFVAIMETTPLVGGHYITFSRRGGSWFHYNDASRPSQVDAEKVTSDEGRKGAYMFFLMSSAI